MNDRPHAGQLPKPRALARLVPWAGTPGGWGVEVLLACGHWSLAFSERSSQLDFPSDPLCCPTCDRDTQLDPGLQAALVAGGPVQAEDLRPEADGGQESGDLPEASAPLTWSEGETATCRHCHELVFRRADGTWDLVYVEWQPTVFCYGRAAPTYGHEPELRVL